MIAVSTGFMNIHFAVHKKKRRKLGQQTTAVAGNRKKKPPVSASARFCGLKSICRISLLYVGWKGEPIRSVYVRWRDAWLDASATIQKNRNEANGFFFVFFLNFIFNSGGGCNLEPFISRLNLIHRDVFTVRTLLLSNIRSRSLSARLLETKHKLCFITGTFDLLFWALAFCFLVMSVSFCLVRLWPTPWTRVVDFDCSLLISLSIHFVVPRCFVCFFFIWFVVNLLLRSETTGVRRSTEWRYNTIITDEASECLESSQQRQYHRGQQRQRARSSQNRSCRRQKVIWALVDHFIHILREREGRRHSLLPFLSFSFIFNLDHVQWA